MAVVRVLLSPAGRSGRAPMFLVTVVFVILCVLFNRAWAGDTARPLLLLGLAAAAWPAQVAIPIRRFHDMNRSWWWVLVFWGGAALGLAALLMDLSATATALGLSPFYALTAPEDYLETLEAYNASTGASLKQVGASGLGGISTAVIFLIIQFGWLHVIPGTRGDNRFGPAPDGANRQGDR